MKIRYFFGIVFLFSQFLSIIFAQSIEERFFCWAPYDQHTYYEVIVSIKGIQLTQTEIQERYHYKPIGWEPRSIYNLINIVNQYESTYGKLDEAQVKIKYSTNGKPEKIWRKK